MWPPHLPVHRRKIRNKTPQIRPGRASNYLPYHTPFRRQQSNGRAIADWHEIACHLRQLLIQRERVRRTPVALLSHLGFRKRFARVLFHQLEEDSRPPVRSTEALCPGSSLSEPMHKTVVLWF